MNLLLLSLAHGSTRMLCLNGLAAIILLIIPLACAASAVDEEALLDNLRTDYAALAAAEHEYRTQRERGALNKREAADYAAYVARLHRIVAEDCRSVMEAGIVVPQGVVCPTLQAIPMPADIDLAAEQTRVEKTGELDAQLMAELGDFDEMLLREQERVKASAPRTDAGAGSGGAGGGGTGGNGSGGDGSGGMSGDGTDGSSGETGDGSRSGNQGSAASASGGGASGSSRGGGASPPGSWNKPGGAGGQPDDIPDGSDDDVVARQLREAAEKETDPELKEKLWEEYRRYKQGTR